MLIRITQDCALRIALGLLTAVIVIHLVIIINIIPYEIVWAGKLKSTNEMYVYEGVSLLMIMVLFSTMLLKGNFIKHKVNDKILNGILWFFMLVFALNTVGNLMAESLFEKAVFTPLTLISAILIWIIVRKERLS